MIREANRSGGIDRKGELTARCIYMDRAHLGNAGQRHTCGGRKPFELSPHEGFEWAKVWHMSLEKPGRVYSSTRSTFARIGSLLRPNLVRSNLPVMAARKAKSKLDEAAAPSFEDSMKRLSQIVEELEAGDLSLEESLSKFEEGVRLARSSQTHLDRAEARVEELLGMDDDGPITEELDVP